MPTYKYTGSGIMSFEVDKKKYTVGINDHRLKDTVELPKKVDVPGLELVGEKKKIKGDE